MKLYEHLFHELAKPDKPRLTIKVEPLFKWFDFWIGFFWDSKKKWLYFLPIPMFGVIIKFEYVSTKPRHNYWLFIAIVAAIVIGAIFKQVA